FENRHSVGIGGVVFSYPLANQRSRISFVFRTILLRPAIATAMFCAFFSLDFGNFHLLPPPRVPPFPTPSTALVLWIHLTSHGKSCFNHTSHFFPYVRETSPGTRILFRLMYLP